MILTLALLPINLVYVSFPVVLLEVTKFNSVGAELESLLLHDANSTIRNAEVINTFFISIILDI
ncbi:hypothetical protein [Flavobacterium sp.]|uniref:hypothetical protein n=1 Tax=Flavobacterium sp. TaxID=239 RepID=UPI001B60A33B|nr:hypothetical protein [Flavobacterium sp.]MBP6181672.1 hypothetical protein [Flavobacterium sp.]